MPLKRRVPKGRAFVPSPELLDFYRHAFDLKSSCLHREDGHLTEDYLTLWHRVHELCGLQPWDKSPLDVEEGELSDYAARAIEIKPEIEAALLEYA